MHWKVGWLTYVDGDSGSSGTHSVACACRVPCDLLHA